MTTTLAQAPGVGSALDADARRLADEIKQRWHDGDPPDVVAALADHPELLAFRPLVVELAYEEYCLHEEEGDGAPEVGPFCARLPAYRGSIRKVIEARRMLHEHPEVFIPEPVWPEPGDTFDGLKVVTELGRGTFARAYLAYDPQTDRGCVLKLSPGRGGEGRALGPLTHPHITDVYWADRADAMTAVCMPLLGVTTLDDVRGAAFRGPGAVPSAAALLGAIQLAAGGPAPPPPVAAPDESYPAAVVAVAVRIADALAYLHGLNREHGDLKPSNVVLAPGGHPYLIDFNLSADDPDTAPLGGTVPYMAPERLERYTTSGAAPPAAACVQADVYSFGVVLFELLTGRLPWPPNPNLGPVGAAADLLARCRVGVPWPDAADVPGPVARVVEACLADAPAARPAAADVATALARWLADTRGAAAKPRRVSPFALLGGLAVAAVIGGVAALRPAGTPTGAEAPGGAAEPPRTVAVAPAPRPEPFHLGLERLRSGDLVDAQGYFKAAENRDRPLSLAYQSYCAAQMALDGKVLLRQNLLSRARDLGEQAVEAGADWAAVNNNIGVTYIVLRQYADAIAPLNRAVDQDRGLVAARYNRAFVRLILMVEANPGDPRFRDREAAEDILAALKQPPESAAFFGVAARVLAATSRLDPSLKGPAIACLRDAVRFGKNPQGFPNDAILHRNLKDDPGFDDLLTLTPGTEPERPDCRLVEPRRP